MRDTQQDKLNRLLNVLKIYEGQRKAALSKGIEFKSPSKSKILADADLNKNYFNQTSDKELLARVDAIAKAPAVKSQAEEKAEKVIEQSDATQKILDKLHAQLEDLLAQNGELTKQLQAKDEQVKQLVSIINSEKTDVGNEPSNQNNVVGFTVIDGGSDNE